MRRGTREKEDKTGKRKVRRTEGQRTTKRGR